MTNLKKDVIDKRLVNSVKYLYLSLRLMWSLFTCKSLKSLKTNVKTSTRYKKSCRRVKRASYSLTQRQLWQLTLKWLPGAHAQDKNKQYYCRFLFFLIFIQLCDSRKIHYLTREFHIKLHLKTDITLIAARFVQYRFSHAISEYPDKSHKIRNFICMTSSH